MKLLLSLMAASMLIGPTITRAASQTAHPIIPAVRRAPDVRPAPQLPAGADQVVPLTLAVSIRRQGSSGLTENVRQTIHRTADRIHVTDSGRREWLFERNVRDTRRVSGSLIDHDSRTIVVYEESDLRNAFGIAGWAHVLALGLDPDLLRNLVSTGETRSVGGIRAVRYAAVEGQRHPSEVWWAAEAAVPLAFTRADGRGVVQLSVERVDAGADAAFLRSPASRFPQYAVVQFADWLERD